MARRERQHTCTACGEIIADAANKRIDRSRMHFEHIACPKGAGEAAADSGSRPITNAEAEAIRAFIRGKVAPGPYMVDGGGPDSAD